MCVIHQKAREIEVVLKKKSEISLTLDFVLSHLTSVKFRSSFYTDSTALIALIQMHAFGYY